MKAELEKDKAALLAADRRIGGLADGREQKLREVAYAPTLQQAERRRRTFQSWACGDGQRAAELIEEDWERMVSYGICELLGGTCGRRRLPSGSRT